MNTIQYSNHQQHPGVYIPEGSAMVTFSVMRKDGLRGFISIPVSIALLQDASVNFGPELVKMAIDALAVANDAVNPNKSSYTHF